MALEDKIDALIKSIDANTDAVKNLSALRADAIETVKKESAPAAKVTKPAETKPADPAPTGLPEAVAQEFMGLIAKYVGGTDREEERTARKARVKKLISHDTIRNPAVAVDVVLAKPDVNHINPASVDAFRTNITTWLSQPDITPAAASTLDI